MASVALGRSDRTRPKRLSAADAAALVASGDWVEYGTGWLSRMSSTPRSRSEWASSTT
jgi:hypothetical protein